MVDEEEDHHETPDMSEVYTLPHQHINLSDFNDKGGMILDIGGSGEGIVGIFKGQKVVAIDRNKRELMGTKNAALKIVMDAKELKFLDDSFDTATVFFSFMYMPEEDLESVMAELWRVLNPGGELLIWDAIVEVPKEELVKKYFLVMMTVHFPDGSKVEAGYGHFLKNQGAEMFLKPAEKIGFNVLEKSEDECTIFARLQKP